MWGKHYNFPHKTLWIDTVFPHMVLCFLCFLFLEYFFLKLSLSILFFSHMIVFIFFPKLSLSIFFNIKLVENYNYNKTKSCGENIVAFLTKHYGLL